MLNLAITFLTSFYLIWIRIKSLVIFCSQTGILLPILIFLNFSITLSLAANLNIWTDEAYSLNTTGKDIGYALHQALYFELQPPLYFILLNLWRSLNSSFLFARLFSILCITLAIYVVAGVSRRFLKEIPPCLVAASVAFNPFVIWAAVEIRLYAFAILLSALLLLSFFDGYLTEVSQAKARWCYLVFSALAIYTQYYLGFLLVANAVALLVVKRWYALRNYIFGMSVVGLCFTPMLMILFYQIDAHTQAITFDHTEKTISITYLFKGVIYILKRVADYTLPVDKSASLPAFLRKICIPIFCIIVLSYLKKYTFILLSIILPYGQLISFCFFFSLSC